MAKKKVTDEINENINTVESVSVDELSTMADEKTVITDQPEADVAEQQAMDEAEQPSLSATVRKGIVNCEELRLRDDPNLNSKVIRLLPKGTEVTIIENANSEFYKVDGGYVMKRYVDEK